MSLTEEMEAHVIILCARDDNAAAEDNDNHHRENLSFLIFWQLQVLCHVLFSTLVSPNRKVKP